MARKNRVQIAENVLRVALGFSVGNDWRILGHGVYWERNGEWIIHMIKIV